MAYHYINGRFTNKDEEATISISDIGLTRGYGVFDVLRTYNKKPFHLYDHFLRLVSSAKEIGLQIPLEFDAYEKIVEQLLILSPLPDITLKTIVTGGLSTNRLLPSSAPTLIVSALPIISFPEELYATGVGVCTTSLKRPFPKSKTLFYVPAILAMREGEKKGALEAIHLNEKKELLEGVTSNFFCFKNGELIATEDAHILTGITHTVALHLAKAEFPIVRRSINYKEIQEIDEAFITSSNKEVLPVTRIDDVIIGSVGPNTKRLMELFQKYVEKEEWKPLSASAPSPHTMSGSPGDY